MPVITYNKIILMLSLTLFLFPGVCSAGLEKEISHLLSYIEKSGCTFNRNGKNYSAPEARDHLERKYSHLRKRIKTSEQFISHVATRSSMSGQLYTVQCGSETFDSSEWLRLELDKFRTPEDSH